MRTLSARRVNRFFDNLSAAPGFEGVLPIGAKVLLDSKEVSDVWTVVSAYSYRDRFSSKRWLRSGQAYYLCHRLGHDGHPVGCPEHGTKPGCCTRVAKTLRPTDMIPVAADVEEDLNRILFGCQSSRGL